MRNWTEEEIEQAIEDEKERAGYDNDSDDDDEEFQEDIAEIERRIRERAANHEDTL